MVELHVVDWLPGGWFLLESNAGEVLLHARYSYSGYVDQSALLRLSPDEINEWRKAGTPYITALARRVSNGYMTLRSEPQQYSVWWKRDLYRTDASREWQEAVTAAIQAWQPWVEWRARQ